LGQRDLLRLSSRLGRWRPSSRLGRLDPRGRLRLSRL